MIDTSIGDYLRAARLQRGISIEEISQTTRIPLRMLEHIEADRFESLPGEVFNRGFLRAYARAVGVDPHVVLARYSELYGQGDSAAPVPAIAPPERGRRFGIAIAVVVLLILFTLALSIVLRPRHRDTPTELSHRSITCPELRSPTPSSCGAFPTARPTASLRS